MSRTHSQSSTASALLICTLFAGGCSSGDFPTAQVTGRVLCDGQPVEGAMVYFEPIRDAKTDGLAGKQGFSYTDAQGKYVISTYDPGEGDGAVVGKHRVRVGRGKAKCDCSMNEEVDLIEVEVKSGVDNEFELVLKKASRQELARQKSNQDEDED